MSIQHAMLALLSVAPATTYQLRSQYDHAMGGCATTQYGAGLGSVVAPRT